MTKLDASILSLVSEMTADNIPTDFQTVHRSLEGRGIRRQPYEVEDLLERLVDKTLLWRHRPPQTVATYHLADRGYP